MSKLSLLSTADVQTNMCQWLKAQRKAANLSREKLAQLSTVPASTIKKFENTSQISLRQFLQLWQSLDELARLNNLTKQSLQIAKAPQSIEEVLRG